MIDVLFEKTQPPLLLQANQLDSRSRTALLPYQSNDKYSPTQNIDRRGIIVVKLVFDVYVHRDKKQYSTPGPAV